MAIPLWITYWIPMDIGAWRFSVLADWHRNMLLRWPPKPCWDRVVVPNNRDGYSHDMLCWCLAPLREDWLPWLNASSQWISSMNAFSNKIYGTWNGRITEHGHQPYGFDVLNSVPIYGHTQHKAKAPQQAEATIEKWLHLGSPSSVHHRNLFPHCTWSHQFCFT